MNCAKMYSPTLINAAGLACDWQVQFGLALVGRRSGGLCGGFPLAAGLALCWRRLSGQLGCGVDSLQYFGSYTVFRAI